MAVTRSDIEGIVNFLAANPEGATDLEREAFAAYQADPEAAIERALTRTNPAGTVETFVMFSREQLRHAGARFLAAQTAEPGLTTITATEIVYGSAYTPRPYYWEPQHPALAILQWECERTDIHGVSGGQFGLGRYSFNCACGWDGPECATEFDATAAIISHALNTCAACGNDKPAQTMDGRMDVFPRCSACAF